MSESTWQSRIVEHGEEAPDQLLANPRNWRIHPKQQQDALGSVLDRVGWVQDVIVNRTTGHVVDGHLRVSLAISRDEPSIPVAYVDLTEDEEALILASFDPISAMAGKDDEVLAQLLEDVSADGALGDMLAKLAGYVDADEFPALPDGDRGEFRQMTFTVTEGQQETIKAALKAAKGAGPFPEGNENSNGNALARIAEAYV